MTALIPIAARREVLRYLRTAGIRRRRCLATAVVAIVAESAIGLAPPVAIGWLTQAIVDHRGTAALIAPVGLLVGAALGGALTAWASRVLLARTLLPELARLREDAVSAALDLPLDEVEAGGIGDLVSRVSGDVESVSEAAEHSLGAFLVAALAILSTLGGLAALDYRFALAGLLAVPIQAHALRWYLRTSAPLYAAGRIAEAGRTATLLGAFAALPTVRAFRLANHQRALVETASRAAVDQELRATHASTRFYGRLNLAEFVGLGAILLVGFMLVRSHAVTVGAATTAALFFAGLFEPINVVLGTFDDIQRACAGLARLVGITNRATPPGAVTTIPPRPELTAQHVDFGYPDGPDVLHEITMRLSPGQHIAMVGASGSGKSTLATLLAGIRHPRRGRITLAGIDLADLDPTARHRAIALVSQETHVFLGTIADNLRLAAPTADDATLLAALDTVGATWVGLLDDGLHTRVGAGAHWLPPAQAQQLALARVLLLDPPIVLLDEATAEAGSDASRQLDAAAAAVLRGRAALVIAHRLGQAVTADQILVLDAGRIVERGTHSELVAAAGPYAQLWRAWSSGEPTRCAAPLGATRAIDSPAEIPNLAGDDHPGK
jgi:ABC-type multidrug transport system fused ATPase/permease subunit